jgi:hypothetical protein
MSNAIGSIVGGPTSVGFWLATGSPTLGASFELGQKAADTLIKLAVKTSVKTSKAGLHYARNRKEIQAIFKYVIVYLVVLSYHRAH